MILSTDILGYGVTIENLGCGGLKFAGKGTEVEKKLLSEVTQTQKMNIIYTH